VVEAPLPPATAVRAQLLDVLEQQDGAPASADLERVAQGAELGSLLVDIADDETAPALARNRALSLLGHHPSPHAQALLERLSRTGATPYVRALAARSLLKVQK
jgi:hypothetical protein